MVDSGMSINPYTFATIPLHGECISTRRSPYSAYQMPRTSETTKPADDQTSQTKTAAQRALEPSQDSDGTEFPNDTPQTRTEHQLVAMLDIVNQLIADHQAGEDTAANLGSLDASVTKQLQERAQELDRRDQALRTREQDCVRRATDLTASRRQLAQRIRQQRDEKLAPSDRSENDSSKEALIESIAKMVRQETSVLHETLNGISQTGFSATGESTDDIAYKQQIQKQQVEIDVLQERLRANQTDLEDSRLEFQNLQETAVDLFAASESNQASGQKHITELHSELNESKKRVSELEAQNSDLAQQVANSQVQEHLSVDENQTLATLSWEERKKVILQRLENEEAKIVLCDDPEVRDNSEDVREEIHTLRQAVQQADQEIARRDAEINELQQLLEQQSGTVGDVAVGAAAIAGIFDQDELIQEERSKLNDIRGEWEEKLRQAEIEVSLERAKLARERQELENRNMEIEELLAHQKRAEAAVSVVTGSDGKPVRRWRAMLGLNDEKGDEPT